MAKYTRPIYIIISYCNIPDKLEDTSSGPVLLWKSQDPLLCYLVCVITLVLVHAYILCAYANLKQQNGLQGVQYCIGFLL